MKHRIFRHNKIISALLLVFLLSGAFLSGCGRESVPYSESGFYFNTVITITVYRSKDARVLKDCLLLCDDYEKKLSRTLQGSDIYRLNHSGGVPVTVSEDTAYLLGQACKFAELSGGRIDPTVAPLMDLWDFTGQAADKNAQKKIPAAADIQALLPHINYKNIRIDGNTVTLTDPQTQVDLGFIAKGFIADRLKERLLEKGVESALINLGGNILAVGSKPDGSPFEIGVRKPFDTQNTALTTLSLSDRSLVSSGVYERYFEKDGKRYHHLLDPFTGYPVENGLLGVTILSSSSMEGDALSTTAFVLGPEEGMALIESLPDTEAVFITEDYKLHYSSGLSGKQSAQNP